MIQFSLLTAVFALIIVLSIPSSSVQPKHVLKGSSSKSNDEEKRLENIPSHQYEKLMTKPIPRQRPKYNDQLKFVDHKVRLTSRDIPKRSRSFSPDSEIENNMNESIRIAEEKRKKLDENIRIRRAKEEFESKKVPYGTYRRFIYVQNLRDNMEKLKEANLYKSTSLYLQHDQPKVSHVFNEIAEKKRKHFKKEDQKFKTGLQHAWFSSNLREKQSNFEKDWRESEEAEKGSIFRPVLNLGIKHQSYFDKKYEHQKKKGKQIISDQNEQEKSNHSQPEILAQSNKRKHNPSNEEEEEKARKKVRLMKMYPEIPNPHSPPHHSK